MHNPGRIRSDRWRDIALVCAVESRTVPAIARALGVEGGSIQSLIASMKREDLLEEVESEARGAALKLTRRGRAELKKHEGTGGVGALFTPGERLVFVLDEGRGLPADTLADLASDPNFRWAVRIDGPVKWIASFGSDDAIAADRAANQLVAAGARAVAGRSDAFLDAAGLDEYASRLGADPPRAIGRAKS
jgi:DNA-binding MarR family transcriptional regulator